MRNIDVYTKKHMTMKRLFAAFIAVMLVANFSVPAFATTVLLPFDNTTYENDEILPDIPTLPDDAINPPEFYTQMKLGGNGYKIKAFFTGYTPGMRDIQAYYSLNGVDYSQMIFGTLDIPDDPEDLPEDFIADEVSSPLKEYLAKEIDTFYIRLHYTTDDGEFISQVEQTTRPTQSKPLPDDMIIYTDYPNSMRLGFKHRYNVTVRAGSTREDVLAVLPQSLPIDVQLMDPNNQILLHTFIDCQVEWDIPDTITSEDTIIPRAVKTVILPEDFQLQTLYDLYIAKTLPPILTPLSLHLNVVDIDDKAEFYMHSSDINYIDPPATPLYMTLPLKPTGAKSIVPSYSLDGGDTWTATQDVLLYNEAIDAYPKNTDYRYISLFNHDQSPYKEYISGEIDGFHVRLDIIGGIFDGQSDIAFYPLDYEYEPPIKDNGIGGSGGNENNAGSRIDNKTSGSTGGLHPDIPDKDKPTVVVVPISPDEKENSGLLHPLYGKDAKLAANDTVTSPEFPSKEKPTKQKKNGNTYTKVDTNTNTVTAVLNSANPQKSVSSKLKKGSTSTEETPATPVVSYVEDISEISEISQSLSIPKTSKPNGLSTVAIVVVLIASVTVIIVTSTSTSTKTKKTKK